MIVAVKLPNDLTERIATFPFLQALDEQLRFIAKEDPEDDTYQIHLISVKKGIDVLNLLPFEAFYHELSEEDTKSVFSMHRGCGHFNFPQGVDKFISTTTSFVDASIGKNIKAAESIGFEVGKNKWLLNTKIPHKEGLHKSDEIAPLIKTFAIEKVEIPNAYSRKIQEVYLDWRENPYMVIDLDLVDDEINPEWKDFISECTNKRFVFMCSELAAGLQRPKVEEFFAELPENNTYKFFKYESNIDFSKVVTYSLAFVTKNSALMSVATYCGAKTFFLNQNTNMKVVGPKYFRGELKEFSFKNPKDFPYNLLFDDLIELLEAKAAEEE